MKLVRRASLVSVAGDDIVSSRWQRVGALNFGEGSGSPCRQADPVAFPFSSSFQADRVVGSDASQARASSIVTRFLLPNRRVFSRPAAISRKAIVREIRAQPQNSSISKTSGLAGGGGMRCDFKTASMAGEDACDIVVKPFRVYPRVLECGSGHEEVTRVRPAGHRGKMEL